MSTLTELARRRGLLGLMVRQDMKTEYGKYQFGILWTLAEPLLVSVLMFVVFHFIFQTTRGIEVQPFIVYLATGMIPFAWLSKSIGSGPKTFRRYGTMLTFSNLPMVTWPLRTVIQGLAEVLTSIPIIILLTVAFGAWFSWGVILVPIGLVAQVFLCLGLAMIFASLGAIFPDTEKLTVMLTRIFFWGSPILWQTKDFGALQDYLYINPFQGILDMYRAAIWPDEVLTDPVNYLVSGISITVIFAAGLLMMKTRTRQIQELG
ncbi:MAG: ABC transporter permease [Actinobacteria bacterium]|nr:ABC transporter permease [Actinomycetota bacterium]